MISFSYEICLALSLKCLITNPKRVLPKKTHLALTNSSIDRWNPFLLVTRFEQLWTLIDVFYGTIIFPPNFTQFQFWSSCGQNPWHDFPLHFEKKKRIVNVTLIGSFNDCLFRETSTDPAPAVAARNSVEEGSSSVLETYWHPSWSKNNELCNIFWMI